MPVSTTANISAKAAELPKANNSRSRNHTTSKAKRQNPDTQAAPSQGRPSNLVGGGTRAGRGVTSGTRVHDHAERAAARIFKVAAVIAVPRMPTAPTR